MTVILLSLLAMFLVPVLSADQEGYRYAINPDTMQCAQFSGGDECVVCTAPKGWTMISQMSCPQGYEHTTVQPICRGKKTPFCCTIYHSGASGDCDDVVVNEKEKKCAFVEDIEQCGRLPEGWEQAGEVDKYCGKLCPKIEYEWLKGTLACEE